MDELAVVGANQRVSGVLPSPARLPKGRLVDEGKTIDWWTVHPTSYCVCCEPPRNNSWVMRSRGIIIVGRAVIINLDQS